MKLKSFVPHLMAVVLAAGSASATAGLIDLRDVGDIYDDELIVFEAANGQSSGTGVIESFVRLLSPGSTSTEEGYNTSDRDTQFNENTSPTFTRDLLLSAIPTVTINGIVYGTFVLDINEPNATRQDATIPEITLTDFRLYSGANQATNTAAGDMQTAPPYMLGTLLPTFLLQHDLLLRDNASGSGAYDLLVYIPMGLLQPGPNVYLYSRFEGATGGFEEWATLRIAQVPVPGTLVLLGLGCLALAGLRGRTAA